VGEADGLMTDVPGLAMGVAVADCVPVYLFEAKRGVGAILHAGRAGTQANMAGAGVRGLVEEFGAVPGEMFAVIGPSAGPCCYEVSQEMAEVFGAAGWVVRGRNLDLWETNRMQLVSAGVPEGQIEVCGRCTICDGGFHSYRAHGTAARNLAVMVL
jgi:YfiH family protein